MSDDREQEEQAAEKRGAPRIKVTDRRLFDRAGNLRPEAARKDADSASRAAPATARVVTGQAEDAPSEPGAPEGPEIADLPRDFGSFVEGLYLDAMLSIGALPDPRTGKMVEDLELARYKIDILSMLQEKTEGNLTAQEAHHLGEILYQLRMAFVQKTKGRA